MNINYPNMARTMVAFLLPFGLQTIEASAAVRGEHVSGILLVEPDTAPPGTQVEVTASRIEPGASIAIALDGSDVCRGQTTRDGVYRCSVTVPRNAKLGNHEIVGRIGALMIPNPKPFRVNTDWPQHRSDARHSGTNFFENVLSPDTVRFIRAQWSGSTAGSNNPVRDKDVIEPYYPDYFEPITRRGVVFVASNDPEGGGRIAAFDTEGCGGAATCDPLWIFESPEAIVSQPAVAGNHVFVPTDQVMYVLKADGCGSMVCSPLWADLAQYADLYAELGYFRSGVTVYGGRVFVKTLKRFTHSEGVHWGSSWHSVGFSVNPCGDAQCGPDWVSTYSYLLPPVMSNGLLYDFWQDSWEQIGYAVPINGPCFFNCQRLSWKFHAATPYMWKQSSYDDGDGEVALWGGISIKGPTVYNNRIYLTGTHDAYYTNHPAEGAHALTFINVTAADCSSTNGECPGLWYAQIKTPLSDGKVPKSAYANNVAVTNGSVYFTVGNALYVFSENCSTSGQRCDPAWSATGDPGEYFGAPTVANGVVYVHSSSNALYAFPAGGCGQNSCDQLARVGSGNGGETVTPVNPVVANGHVLVQSADDATLRVFGLVSSP